MKNNAPNLALAMAQGGVTRAPLLPQRATMEIADGAKVELLGDYRPSRFD